jgi:signal transduction histidine kinase
MRQMEAAAGWVGAERKRVEAVVETLATLRSEGENLAEVAHDTRNMVTALALYCDLLEEPGVLAKPYLHYGSELRLVAAASRRLVERLVALDANGAHEGAGTGSPAGAQRVPPRLPANGLDHPQGVPLGKPRGWDSMPAAPIENMAEEVIANRNLLAALAGPSIAVTVDTEGSAQPVWLTGEDLTRLLVNLVKNAAEAMPSGGRIQLGLREAAVEPGKAIRLILTIEDNGPGIPSKTLERIFDSGYTSHPQGASAKDGWPAAHRGLGLAITRSIVEGAGGSIHAVSRIPSGARFEIELPVRSR